MTDEQKYNELLKAIGQYLRIKNDEIIIQEYEISTLRKKLETAEEKIKSLEERN